MATDKGSNFPKAYKRLQDMAGKEPEFFDFANRIIKLIDSGEHLTLGAIMLGLKEAYELGRAGKPVEQDPVMKRFRETGSTGMVEENPPAPRNRIVRRPA